MPFLYAELTSSPSHFNFYLNFGHKAQFPVPEKRFSGTGNRLASVLDIRLSTLHIHAGKLLCVRIEMRGRRSELRIQKWHAGFSCAQININISYELIEYNAWYRISAWCIVTCMEQLNPSCNMHVRIAITCMFHKPACYMSVTCVWDMYPTCT